MAELINRVRYEAALAKSLAETLGGFRKSIFSTLTAGNPISPSVWSDLQAAVRTTLEQWLAALHHQSSLEHFVAALSDVPTQAGDVAVGAATDANLALATAEARMQSESINWGASRANEVSSRLARNVQQEIESKVADYQSIRAAGEAVPQSKIRDDLVSSLGPERAANVATTEITNAAATGGERGMSAASDAFPESGGPDEFDLWINNPHLSRTGPCPICEPLHKTPRSVWAEQFPDGPPAHPNCLLPETEVTAGSVIAGISAWYDGPAIRLVVSENRSLSVTPNHLLLTPQGFVAAKDIRKGDYLFNASVLERIAFGTPNNDYRPPFAEKIIASLSESSSMASSSVPISSEYLHGDASGCQGDINVVWSDSFLRDACESGILKSGDGLPLVTRYSRSRLSGLGLLDTVFSLLSLASHGFVSSRCNFLSVLWSRLSKSDNLTFASAARGEAPFNHSTAKGSAVNTETLGRLVERFASLVFLDQVVNVDVFNTSHWVYDLQTLSGIYCSNGILSSNCVCEIDYANGPGPGRLRGASVLPNGENVVDLFRRAQGITGPLLS